MPADAAGAVTTAINRVRFTQPVRVGAKLRAGARIVAVVPIGPDQCAVTMSVFLEAQGSPSMPVLTADLVSLIVR